MNPETAVIQGIYGDIENSLNVILDARAAELNDLLRVQQEKVQMVAHSKQVALSQLITKRKLNDTQKIIANLDKKFLEEELKLKEELDKLKQVIMRSIIEQDCNEKKQGMSDFMVKYLKDIKKSVRNTRDVAMIAAEHQLEDQRFSNIISGFSGRFYERFDRLNEYLRIQILKLNEFLQTPVDPDIGIDELVFETTSSKSATIKTNATTATDETGRLLDNALRPGVGCIAKVGFQEIQTGLNVIVSRLHNYIFSDITSDSGRTGLSSIMNRKRILDNAAPRNVFLGNISPTGSDSSIDTEILDFSPSDTISTLGKPEPFYTGTDLRRFSSMPLPFAKGLGDSDDRRSDDPRLHNKNPRPGKARITKRRDRVLEMNKPYSSKSSKSKGGKNNSNTKRSNKSNQNKKRN